jgi:hypothetical protein
MSKDDSDTVQAVMTKPMVEKINGLLAPSGWTLMRAPFLDDDDPEGLPIYLATIVPGGAAEAMLLRMREER